MSFPSNKWIGGLALSVIALTLSSCCEKDGVDYCNRYEGVSFAGGNAMEANTGIHTVKPFPKAALNTDINLDGKSVVNAQNRYLKPGDPDVVPYGDKSSAKK